MEEFKSSKVRLQMMLDDSKDKVVKSLNPTLKTGRKWKAKDTIISAKGKPSFQGSNWSHSNRETRFRSE